MEKNMFEKFIVTVDQTLLDVIKKIDNNKNGFVIVVDDKNHVEGTVTDGDVRRALIANKELSTPIGDICVRTCTKLNNNQGLTVAIDLFKNSAIKFLPIVNEDNILTNIVTKSQMHALLLQDIQADLSYKFYDLDEKIVDEEIYYRPWGFYKTTMMNDYFQSKVISVNPKSQLSLQSHNRREEHWIVAHGVGTVQIGESVIDVKCGSALFIPKGCKHRLTNISESEALIITEVQIGDYFGEDDIIRYEDIYGRI